MINLCIQSLRGAMLEIPDRLTQSSAQFGQSFGTKEENNDYKNNDEFIKA